MKRVFVLGVVVASGLLTISVAAFQAPAPAAPKVLDIVKVRDNLYVITSSSPTPRELFSGGNVAVFITDAGVTLVDTKLTGWGPALIEKVKSVTNKPVTTIINTHTHGDHTGNNDAFGKVEVVAHENTKANMMKMDAFKGKEQFLPGKTYKDKMSLLRSALRRMFAHASSLISIARVLAAPAFAAASAKAPWFAKQSSTRRPRACAATAA